MLPQYATWIDGYVVRQGGHVRGLCQSAAIEMAQCFPELRTVRGFVRTMSLGQHTHWWCETGEGQIVDPTAAQFAHEGGASSYIELDVTNADLCGQIRMGTCMNCGGDVLGLHRAGVPFCSKECEQDFIQWQGEEPRKDPPEVVEIEDVLIFTRLLDDGRLLRCSCGFHYRVPGDCADPCPACGLTQAHATSTSEADYRASRKTPWEQ